MLLVFLSSISVAADSSFLSVYEEILRESEVTDHKPLHKRVKHSHGDTG